jgi:Cu(I)/Ag(I) efflux system membrane fusion protein
MRHVLPLLVTAAFVGTACTGSAPVPRVAEVWICPMHPEIVRDGPAECPACGMDLVRKVDEAVPGDSGPVEVALSPEVIHRLGVRTAAVERRELPKRIETVGYVEYDRSRLWHVYPLSAGTIQRLTVHSEGERIRKGEFLFHLASPMLSRTKDETYAEADGIVVALNVIDGQWVEPDAPAITMGDLSTVWVLAEVFEGQASWVRPGQSAEIRVASDKERTWRARVQYVYPNLDPETRTLKVRMTVPNPGEALKPNMLAEVILDCGSSEAALAVPREALIDTGREERVVLSLGGGKFSPRTVVSGLESDDWVQIVEGLEEGEEVVVSAQFLIDSEASLRSSLERMTPRATATGGGAE